MSVVFIAGQPATGKTTSLMNLPKDGVLYFNTEGKDLPFREPFKYSITTDNTDVIVDQIRKMPMKIAVIDDAGYLMTHMFMREHRNKSGDKSFQMYDDIGDMMYFLVKRLKEVGDEKIIYIIFHEDVDDYGNVKIRTIGRLLDNKVCLEGMITVFLRCMSSNGRHYFRTQTNGFDKAKSPIGMFTEEEIPNDLVIVDKAIREYYGYKPIEYIKEEEK